MANVPNNLRYTKEHEWAKLEGDIVTVGITDFAQSSLGDVVFCELPDAGKDLKNGQAFGVVESIKSVSDLYSPLAGIVVESNSELVASPEMCNQSCYDKAWMIKLKISNTNDFNSLLSAEEYNNFLASL